MERVQTSEVKKIFFKDEQCNRPNFDLFNIKEITENAIKNLPENEYELKALYNIVRQTVYRIIEIEYEEHGRIVVAVKIENKKPVIYGHTKKEKLLTNNAERKKKKIESQVKKYNLLKADTQNKVNEKYWSQLEINFEYATDIVKK